MRSFFFILLLSIGCNPVHAWGDKGHQITATIAWHYLSPATREKIDALLRDGNDPVATGAVSEPAFVSISTWADAYRDSDRKATSSHREQSRYEQTRRWHYINLKLDHPDFAGACYGSPRLKPQQPASHGPAKACITDKVEQFAAELASSRTATEERRLALQFLIHLVGDLHQPLHVGDNDDAGGNDIDVSAKGFKRGTLHRYWDTAILARLGRKPATIARKLVEQTNRKQLRLWRRGHPRDWTLETFGVTRDYVYAPLPGADANGVHMLDENYVNAAKQTAARQLVKAGVRLAYLLENAFAAQSPPQRAR